MARNTVVADSDQQVGPGIRLKSQLNRHRDANLESGVGLAANHGFREENDALGSKYPS